jgi:hypothetical protein
MITTPRFLRAFVLALTFAGLPASAQAQSDDWEIVLAPYVLFGSLTGDAAIGPSGPTAVDLSFGDLVKNLELGAMLHTEVWKGDWGVMADLVFMRLGDDLPLVRTALDIEVNEVVAEALMGRRFDGPDRRIDVFAGIRYWDLDLDLELANTPSALDLGDEWIDPVVGGRLVQNVSEDWFLNARGDIGGFGLGSTFSWNLQGGVGYDVSDRFSVVAQYKALSVDFDNEKTGLDFLSYDTITHGPLIGFVFHF